METTRRLHGLDDWTIIEQLLPVGWEAAARTHGAWRRARGVADPAALLRTLLIHLADGCSLKETALRARQAGWASVSSVALFKRLQASEQWLRWMAENLWREAIGRSSIDTGSRCVRVVDATTVQEPGNTGTDWRVHYAIQLSNLQCDFFELTDALGGETFRRIPARAGDLMLGDRAYGTPFGVAHVINSQADVLVRVNLRSLPIYDNAGKPIAILSWLKTLKMGRPRTRTAWVWHAGVWYTGRLIAIRRGRKAAQRARRRLLRISSRKQRATSPASLAAASFVFVWTSVPANQLTPKSALELYRLRWQIELAFKRMKSILGLGQLPKQSVGSARAWLHGKLFLALLLERLLDMADRFSPWGYHLDAPSQSLARDAVSGPRTHLRRRS